MVPNRSPIHFTNELEVAASPETIWSLLVDPNAWPRLYPGVQHVQPLDEHKSLHLSTRFETNLAGQDASASAQEFEPMTRIAWGGCPKASEASGLITHGIITPMPKDATFGPKRRCRVRCGSNWLKTLDGFWLTHEKLLAALAKVAAKRVGSRTKETAAW